MPLFLEANHFTTFLLQKLNYHFLLQQKFREIAHCVNDHVHCMYLVNDPALTSLSKHSSSAKKVSQPWPQILMGNFSHWVSPTKAVPFWDLSIYLVVQLDS